MYTFNFEDERGVLRKGSKSGLYVAIRVCEEGKEMGGIDCVVGWDSKEDLGSV